MHISSSSNTSSPSFLTKATRRIPVSSRRSKSNCWGESHCAGKVSLHVRNLPTRTCGQAGPAWWSPDKGQLKGVMTYSESFFYHLTPSKNRFPSNILIYQNEDNLSIIQHICRACMLLVKTEAGVQYVSNSVAFTKTCECTTAGENKTKFSAKHFRQQHFIQTWLTKCSGFIYCFIYIHI